MSMTTGIVEVFFTLDEYGATFYAILAVKG